MCWVPATRSRPASFPAGCAARTTTAAHATPTRAVRWSCRGTAARRPCPRASSSTISSPTRPGHPAARPGCDADAAAPGHRAARAPRRGVRVRVRSSQPVLRARAARGRGRVAAAGAETPAGRSGGGDGDRTRIARKRGHPVRRPLRPGRAERGHRARLVDRAARGIARIQSRRVRSRPLGGHHAPQLAGRAHRQVPSSTSIRTTPSPTGSSRKRRFARCTTRSRQAATSSCSRSFRRSTCRVTTTRYCGRSSACTTLGSTRSGGSWNRCPRRSGQAVDKLIGERDPYCRGVVLLGLNASVDVLAAGFRDAQASRFCRGFAVGRTIFQEPGAAWLAGAIDDAELKRAGARQFRGH